MPLNNILTVKNLTVILGKQLILNNINFEINQGEIVALVGPNGAGKSILLKTLIGLIDYQGKIEILGKDHHQMLNLLGYLPQYYSIDPALPLTTEEFFVINMIKKEKIIEVLKLVDIENLINKKINELSGGQLERVLFARAIASDPKILLLDEPISETDVSGQKEFYQIIKYLNQEKNMTILIVTHEIYLLRYFAQRVICLNHSLICDLPVKNVLEEDILKKIYGQYITFFDQN
ncbi:MAG: putative metal transport system ATP-binding protein [Candidatus Parcubacteria bacterium]|nr:MAG: putative metal transport system ATP-binding protein [Candidatus Parcubacteria bacterium]